MRAVALAFVGGVAAAVFVGLSVFGRGASPSAHAVDGIAGVAPASASAPAPATLTKLPSFPTHCRLPPGAAWAVAKPADAPSFNMAVYRTGYIAEAMRDRGWWEMRDTRVMTRVGKFFKKKVGFDHPITLLDVGANIGTWSFFFVAQGHRAVMVDGNPANHAMINATLCANPKFADRVIVKYALLGPPESIGQVCGINLAPQAGGNGHVVCGDEMKADRAKGIAMDYMPLRTLQTVLDEVGVLDYQAFKMDVEGYECKVLAGAPLMLERFSLNYVMVEQTFPAVRKCMADFTKSGGFEVLADRDDIAIARGAILN